MPCIIKIVKCLDIWFIFVQMAQSLDLTGEVFNLIAGLKWKERRRACHAFDPLNLPLNMPAGVMARRRLTSGGRNDVGSRRGAYGSKGVGTFSLDTGSVEWTSGTPRRPRRVGRDPCGPRQRGAHLSQAPLLLRRPGPPSTRPVTRLHRHGQWQRRS
jgi:hypothetical protein